MVGSLVCLTLAVACGQPTTDAPAQRASRGPAEKLATEMARVDGVPIDLAEVQQVTDATHLAPNIVLERLIGERLLIEEAQRRGFDQRPEVEHVARQAAVQALLAKEVERRIPSDDEVADAFAAQRARFEQPERRKSLHVLVTVKRDEPAERSQIAERLAQAAIQELTSAPDARTVWERYRTLGALDGFAITAEELPAVSRADAYAPEYLEGLFSRAEPGVVQTPKHTSFGWHAIVVTEIVPAQNTTLEQARDTLRKELATTQRKAALDALVESTREKHRVVPNEPMIETLLHADAEALGLSSP